MITKRGFFILLILSIVIAMTFSFVFSSFFKPTQADIRSFTQSEINSNKNTSVLSLIKNLKDHSPILRREAIMALGKTKNNEAIMPLFNLVMESSATDVDIDLIATSLYQMTNGKIIAYVVQLLSLNYSGQAAKNSSNSSITDRLTITQTINLLHILMQITKEQMEKDKYNLDFLANLLVLKNNALTLTVLNCISVLNYDALYYKVQNIYSQSLFTKIPVIQTITRLALNYEKYKQNAMNFILKQITEEVHPDVQEENYLALYMLTRHLLELSPETEELVKKIVGLNSNSFDFAFQQEQNLLSSGFKQEQISLIQFFLSDFIPVRLQSRLLNILFFQKEISFLDQEWLKKNLQHRSMDTSGDTSHLDLAKISLLSLATMAQTKEDVHSIVYYLNEKKLTYTVIQAFHFMLEKAALKDFIGELLYSIKNAISSEPSLISWYAFVAYKSKGLDDLKHILDVQSEKYQMQIFHDMAGCGISLNERKELVQTYGAKSQNPFYQTILDEVVQGDNTCYFG